MLSDKQMFTLYIEFQKNKRYFSMVLIASTQYNYSIYCWTLKFILYLYPPPPFFLSIDEFLFVIVLMTVRVGTFFYITIIIIMVLYNELINTFLTVIAFRWPSSISSYSTQWSIAYIVVILCVFFKTARRSFTVSNERG